MKNDFKVLEWLRRVRDQYAEETKGMTDDERISRLREETASWRIALLERQQKSRSLVAEGQAPFGGKRR